MIKQQKKAKSKLSFQLPNGAKNSGKWIQGVYGRLRKKRLFMGFVFLIVLIPVSALVVIQVMPRSARGYANTLPGNDGAVLAECSEDDFSGLKLELERKWHLTGSEILRSPLKYRVVLDKQCKLPTVKAAINVKQKAEVKDELILPKDLNKWQDLSISALGVAEYELNLKLENRDVAKTAKFYVSKPVYVAWTIDWEGYNLPDSYLKSIMDLTNREQKVPLTHFFNARYFVQGVGLTSRGRDYINWIKAREVTHSDYVGLHIHSFYDLVEAAGVTPRTDPTWGSRGTGSDVPFSEYTFEEQKQILQFSVDTLKRYGISGLKAFRGGGWYADLDTMQALQDLGFTMESSGRTNYSLGNGLPGVWNLSATQQPYSVCKTNINARCTGSRAFKIMEMPNNGGESYRFTTQQLLTRFDQNFKSGVQSSHRVINYLSHPEWFNVDQPKMTQVFNHIDQYLYAADRGPVVYANLDTIYNAWIANKY